MVSTYSDTDRKFALFVVITELMSHICCLKEGKVLTYVESQLALNLIYLLGKDEDTCK